MKIAVGPVSRVLVVCLFGAGCASDAQIALFETARQTFEASRAASTQSVAQLGQREIAQIRAARLQAMRDAVAASDRGSAARFEAIAFATADAEIWSPLGEPPLASGIVAALDTVSAYNAALFGIATGARTEALIAQARALGGAATGLAAVGGVTLGPAAVPVVAVAEELARLGLNWRSRAVFREEMLATAPQVRELLVQLRDGAAPLIFDRLSLEQRVAIRLYDPDIDPPAALDAALAAVNETRVLASNWVVLMNRNIAALDAAIAAVREPGAGIDLSEATRRLEEVRLAAIVVERNLIRAGR